MVTKYFTDSVQWRAWLTDHFDRESAIWLEYPKKKTGKKRIFYNHAVEEALCFGWIDSPVKALNEDTSIQRFCQRRLNSTFSQANKERLKWLLQERLIHPTIEKVVQETFVFPVDILDRLKANPATWKHYNNFSAAYRRIRIAYIESARKRPEEFDKRLNNFLLKTKENKLIKGFGGIDKYY
ncbi:MAG: YdeI/OmpD-associated family protein [Bacteroidota bacterium]